MIKQKLYASVCFLFLSTSVLMAQENTQLYFQVENGGRVQFNTNSELAQGKSHPNQVTVRIFNYFPWKKVNYWKLTVRLAGDFNSLFNNYQVDASWADLIFNHETNYSSDSHLINPSNVPIHIDKFNEVTLIESDIPLNYQTHRTFSYDLAIEGGTQLLTIPNGIYATSYEFRVYSKVNANDDYSLAGTYTTPQTAGFLINYNGNYGWQSIELQNSANLVNLEFSTAEDYTNGKSVYIPQGLKVTSYNTHQVLVKTSNSVFTSASSSATIPVSKLEVDVRLSTPENNVSLHGPLSLSTTDQVLIDRKATWPQTLEYDLRFFIPPNTLQASDVQQGGTFSAFVFFTISPN
ncbi:hypothetical protein [Mesonia aestuariivivens]|uniref:Uncharacterized protein n=1 Tax=Mesonia aestuariivivens TaxID=2796128 RepID=A0ABS6W1V7_9FLAO|nr:hypothetical protein [Mesonia aestuariivivens]MBW2961831.1 hypothetical protein [Mesonia aestuariivivens]